MGSAPFRGNFKPQNIENALKGYPSCQTFTLQSAFKYDHPQQEVAEAIKKINTAKRKDPLPVDEKRVLPLIEKATRSYQDQLPNVGAVVNKLATFIPKRRMRKLHIGLFGYARKIGKFSLPRAIPFCASLYSIGLPPELIGLSCIDDNDLKIIQENYPFPYFEEDLRDALAYFNERSLILFPPKFRRQIKKAISLVDFQNDKEHKKITNEIISHFQKSHFAALPELIMQGGAKRKFLG